MSKHRRTALVLTAAACVAGAGPALAVDGANNVSVSLSTVGGTRQFDALQADGTTPLTALTLGGTGSQAFKTRVKDTNFTTLTKGYSVTATMSNLYLKRGDGTHDVATRIPSSQLSLAQGPLTADALTATLLPKLSVSGTLGSCSALASSVPSLGLTTVGGVLQIPAGAVGTLCTALGAGVAVPATTVDGVLKRVTATVSDVTSLPNALTAGLGGPFTNADYSQDAVAKTDTEGATGAPPATGIRVMDGATALTLPAALANQLKGALTTALAGTPLTSATDTGSQAPLSSVASAVGGATSTAVGTAISGLTAIQQSDLLNTLSATPLAPTLSALKDLTSSYYGNPTLKAVLTAPVPGSYDGTLTLTFVQS